MTKNKSKILILAIFSVALILSTFFVSAAQPINLGTAGNFVILAKTGISTTGTTSITGNIGVSPVAATYITGFGALPLDSSGTFSTSILVNGSIYASDYAVPTPTMMTTAIGDIQTAYSNAKGLAPDVTELGAGDIGGLTLAPGVYSWGTGLIIPTDVTLSGNSTDVWIFQIAQTLDLSDGKQIILGGDAQAKNVFWIVSGQTTLGTTSVFNGNILDQVAIVLNSGAVLNGRALSQTAVTVGSSQISLPAGIVISDDILPPIVTLNTPNNTWTNDNQTSFNFTFIDTASSTANCTLFIENLVYNSSLIVNNNTPTLIIPTPSLAEGAYEWYVACTDLSNNTGTSTSRIIHINDNTTAPVVSNISSSSITSSGAIIAWTTNQVANSTVNYGTTLDLGSIAESSSFTTDHSISLPLSASTFYYYNVTSCDPTGNCNTSSTNNLTTSAISPTSGGGSSSGGGYCLTEWECTEWSACTNNIQTRDCSYMENWCEPKEDKPITSQTCISNIDNAQDTINLNSPEKDSTKGVPLTGNFISSGLGVGDGVKGLTAWGWIAIAVLLGIGVLAILLIIKLSKK
ncbi:MAG: ice-binding family protein [archaeon]|jgi:hypothetical protein